MNNITHEKDSPQLHWLEMPDFQQTSQKPYAKIIVRVQTAEQLLELSRRLEQPLTQKTKSVWFPCKSHWGAEKKVWVSNES
jgi:hypothetical protein